MYKTRTNKRISRISFKRRLLIIIIKENNNDETEEISEVTMSDKIKLCTGCGMSYIEGTNCGCGYLSIADDAISIKSVPVLDCMDYIGTSSDSKVIGYVCNNSEHEHCG